MPLSDEDLKLLEYFDKSHNDILKSKTENFSINAKNLLVKVKEKLNKNSTFSLSGEKKYKEYDFNLNKNLTLGIDRKSDKRLISGKYKIDYKLDLHGETLENAYNKVKRVFELSELKKYRCLLIITGKGLHSSDKTIKNSIIEWFKEPYFSNRIIKYTDAAIKDGGSGAIYILLRK